MIKTTTNNILLTLATISSFFFATQYTTRAQSPVGSPDYAKVQSPGSLDELQQSPPAMLNSLAPLFELTPGYRTDYDLVTVKYVGLRSNYNYELKSNSVDTLKLDSITIQVDERGRIEALDLRHELPYSMPPKYSTSFEFEFTPLIRDTMSIYLTLYGDFGELSQTIPVGQINWTLDAQTKRGSNRVEICAAGPVASYLIFKNTGEIDTEVLSVELESSKNTLTVQSDWSAAGQLVRSGEDLIIPLSNTLTIDEEDELTVTINSSAGQISNTYPIIAVRPEIDGAADWTTRIPNNGLGINYSSDSKRITVRSSSKAYVLDAGSGHLLDTKRNNRTSGPNDLLFSRWRTDDVGFNADATLAAIGGVYVEDNELHTQLEIHEIGTGQILDSIKLHETNERLVQSRFVEGDSIIAINMFHNLKLEYLNSSIGRFGLINTSTSEWEYLEIGKSSYNLLVSPSGRFVTFQPYSFDLNNRPGSSSSSTHTSSKTLDRQSAIFLDVPFENYLVKFSPDYQQSIFYEYDEFNKPMATYLRQGQTRFVTLARHQTRGLTFFPDSDHIAYLLTDPDTGIRSIEVAHLASGSVVVGNCNDLPDNSNAIVLSPDGSKIAYVTTSGYIQQIDLNCEIEDIEVVDVKQDFAQTSITAAAGFKLAPNPVNSLLLVEHPEVSNGVIRIIDLTGREILSLPINNKQNSQIDVSRLSPGVYGVNVMNGHSHVDTRHAATPSQQLFVKR